ncbi:alpha/beta fold hydrolase [Rhodococcus sp. NPDC058521]|uniref:alpha/beta fold hydrolase n=1 Tax=Rhodococcus sp. NPDC058521 TaxID=3346536 RepID=UPI00364EF1FA
MATFVLLPGAGSDSFYWHRVSPMLSNNGHAVITVDLPYADAEAGQYEFADLVAEGAACTAQPLILVAQSMSAFTAAIVCEKIEVDLLVLVAPMLPAPGESPGQWWENTGQEAARRAADVEEGRNPDAPMDPIPLFFHDVPPEVADEVLGRGEVTMADTPFETVWDAQSWPEVPIRVVAGRYDRLFPLDFLEKLARDRVGVDVDVVDAGHLIALSRPEQLAALLEEYVTDLPG